MRAFLALVRRDLALALRRGGSAALTLAFFAVAVALFPLGAGPEPALLARISAGVVWVAALLAATVSLDGLFRADFEDGSLELLALSPMPLELAALAKCVAHWLLTGLPVTLAAPLLAAMLRLDAAHCGVLALTLAIGTPALSLIGAAGAALALGARRASALVGLLVLPLFMPVMVFGAAAVEASAAGLPVLPPILIEAAVTLVAAPVGLLGAAAALRLALE